MPDRRQFVSTFAAGLVGLGAGCISTLDDDGDAAESSPQGDSQDSMSKVGVESINWDGTTLVIAFDPSFDEWDGWVIHHEYEGPGEYRVVGGEYPRLDEPQRIPFSEKLKESVPDAYSSTTFEITTFAGLADPWDDEYGQGMVAWNEFGPSETFDVPQEVLREAEVTG